MNGRNLVALSNLAEKTNECLGESICIKSGIVGSVTIATLIGAAALSLKSEKILPMNNHIRSSYTQYVNLNQKKGSRGSYTNNVIDLMKVENINKINKMAAFEDDWNGTGGRAFSPKAITLFLSIIETLEKQPGIAPTGRNSLLMQYELADKSILAFEVGEEKTEKVYVPQGDYFMAQTELLTGNVGHRIKECVEKFYGFK